MPECVRQGDATLGHPPPHVPHGPRTLYDPVSTKIFVEGKPVVRATDLVLPPHTPPSPPPPNPITAGSTKVFADGLPVARKGDPISCGDKCEEGSSKVFVGG